MIMITVILPLEVDACEPINGKLTNFYSFFQHPYPSEDQKKQLGKH